MSTIHPTAIVDGRARLGTDVTVGPYTVIDGEVEIGEGTTIGSHNVITGRTTIGRDNRVFHFCSIGEANQDKKYKGEPTKLTIGDRNTIREFATLNRGTVQDTGTTVIGNDNWLMAYCHVAHDCVVGNNVVFANGTTLGGHVIVGDYVTMGGYAAAHQFVKIGMHAMVGAGAIMIQDVVPYVMVAGQPPVSHGINAEGLKRRGFTADGILALKRAYKVLFKSKLSMADAKVELAKLAAENADVRPMVDFLETSTRGILR